MTRKQIEKRDVKNKCICLEHFQYRAMVYLYRGEDINLGLFLSLKAAQNALKDYPNDIFEGRDYLSGNKPLS